MAHVIGCDVGSQSLKGVLIDGDGHIIAEASAPYDLSFPHPGWAEQNPDDWLRALSVVISALLRRSGVAASGVGALAAHSTSTSISGIITPHEVKEVERARWPYTTVDDVLRSLDRLNTVSPDIPVADALERMNREDVNQLPVIQEGRLAGIISRGHILQLFQTRAELNA